MRSLSKAGGLNIPHYEYEILDNNGKPTGERFEIFQQMSEESLTVQPETGKPCRRAIVIPNVAHSGPAWDWCESTRRYINDSKPKYIRDDKTGIRKRMPKGGV